MFLCLSGVGWWWQLAKQGHQELICSVVQLLLGDPEAFKGLMRYTFPPHIHTHTYTHILGLQQVSSQLVMPQKPPKGGTLGHPDPTPEQPQPAPFSTKEQQLYCQLPLDARDPHMILKTHFNHLNPWCHSLCHHPELVTVQQTFTSAYMLLLHT